jgi:hypothetical protein
MVILYFTVVFIFKTYPWPALHLKMRRGWPVSKVFLRISFPLSKVYFALGSILFLQLHGLSDEHSTAW